MKTTIRDLVDGPYPLAGIKGAVEKKSSVSPLAQHVASHLTDPVGSTKETFGDLSQKKLDYQQAQENAKLQLAPVKSFIQQAEQQHGLDQNQNGIPDDEEMGYQDPNNPNPMMGKPGMPGMNPNLPPNMQQKPGMMQQNNPAMNKNVPGTGPKLYPGRSPAPGSMVRPQNMGTAQPGMQNPAGTPSAKPPAAGPKKVTQKKPGAAPGRSIKVHVAANAGQVSMKRTKLDAAIANSNMSSCSMKK